jgi:hypothetical protein
MNPREDDPDFAQRRPAFGDQRDDYDDDFQCRWSPYERARRMVLVPAVAFQVIGPLGVIVMIVAAVALVDANLARALSGSTHHLVMLVLWLPLVAVGLVLFPLVSIGGQNMMRLRRRRLVLFAAIFVTGLSIAGCYAILFYPFGIWGLIVLRRPEVREQFGRRAPPRDDTHGEL